MKATRPPVPHRTAGFTLVEVVFVLVLLGILVMLSAPSLAGWVQRSRVDGAASQVAADLAYARMLAVRSGAGAAVSFDADGQTYTIQATNGAARQVRLGTEYPRVRLAPIAPLSLPLTLEFDSRGFLRDPERAGVLVAREDGRSTSLRILASGRAFVGD